MRLIVGSLSITHHGHDVGERHSRAIILVSVDKDPEALESIGRAEDRALGGALLGEPHCKAIAVQVALAVNFEFQLNLRPVSFMNIICS